MNEEPKETIRPLEKLTTRESNDFSLALLDSWAVVADVLTFYQERLANEGYLRTATERRSILELARLVGYTLRPGVASSVYLAFTLEKGCQVEIPAETTRAQSLPGPGELPQSFETSEPLLARAEWNNLVPRLTRPQRICPHTGTIYFQGLATNLERNDPLLLVFGKDAGQQVLRRVETVKPQAAENRTKVTLQSVNGTIPTLTSPAPGVLSGASVLFEWDANGVAVTKWKLQVGTTPGGKEIFEQDFEPETLSHMSHTVTTLPTNGQDIYVRLSYVLAGKECTRDFQFTAASSDRPGSELPGDLIGFLDVRDSVRSIHHTVDRYLNLARMGVNPESALTKRVVTILQSLNANLSGEMPPERVFALLDEILPQLRAEHATAVEVGYARLEPWVGGIVADLARIRSTGISAGARARIDNPTTGIEKTHRLGFPDLDSLSKPPSLQPSNARRLERSTEKIFSDMADMAPQLLTTLRPELKPNFYQAWRNIGQPEHPVEVYALRVTASLFGHNAPRKILRIEPKTGKILETGEWPVIEEGEEPILHEDDGVVYLDATYDKIIEGNWLVIETDATTLTNLAQLFVKAKNPNATVGRAEYGMSGKTTRIELVKPYDSSVDQLWTIDFLENVAPTPEKDFEAIRKTKVYGESEQLELAEAPIDPTDEPIEGMSIELGALYHGLESGRWLIVTGERVDIPEVTGVTASELVMLAGVEQKIDLDLPGDKTHTFLTLAKEGLAYKYKRDTVRICGNVVKATHGETRTQVLGSGDASKSLQSFSLNQSPLTYLSAPTPDGAQSTLTIYVDDIQWHEAGTLAGLAPPDHRFITRTDDDGKTTLTFGNGLQGARLPTGMENVKAKYRSGIGKPGNVRAEQCSLLASKPLGVKEVVNPLRASGGADRESRDQARGNVPLAVMSLDRLVSVQDYEDFARTFAGIGKASAMLLSDGFRQVLHLTIAGIDDIPIDKNADLYRNLYKALHQFGDPHQHILLDMRELMLVIVSANVRVLADYQWESVEPKIRSALLENFSFNKRDLGQDVTLSEVISVMQKVPGVAYVDVDILDSASEAVIITENFKILKHLQAKEQPQPRIAVELADSNSTSANGSAGIRPAQLAYLSPELPDTLILKEI